MTIAGTKLAPRAYSAASQRAAKRYIQRVQSGEEVTGSLVKLAVQRHQVDLERAKFAAFPYRFDPSAPQRVFRLFSYLSHYKDAWAGKQFRMSPWQAFITWVLYGWQCKDGGGRRYRIAFISVGKKNGKALALDTPIPTPTGWTTMGEIKEGDQVLDESGKPARVARVTPVMRDHQCFRVRFSDGDSIVADTDHQWLTERLDHHLYTSGVRSTSEISATLARKDGARLHRIRLASPLQLDDATLPIEPYVLGVWLGDGSSAGAAFTVGAKDEQEMISHISQAGVCAVRLSTPNRAAGYRLGNVENHRSDFVIGLRSLGLVQNKHIPAAYLRGSLAQRLALLQGLMDTDGHITPRGQCEFTTTRSQIRDGFLELARSLGYKAIAHGGMATIYGREIGPKWRITFHGQRDRPPFRLARKLLRCAPVPSMARRSSHRHIVSVDPVDSVPVRCIQVDSASSLFLAGRSMIPTHNTAWAAGNGLYLAFADGVAGANVYSAATKRDQARLSHGDAIHMAKASAPLASRLEFFKDNICLPRTNSAFLPLGANHDTTDGLDVHAAIVDELHRHKGRDLWDVLEYGTSARRQPLIIGITTAGEDLNSFCYELREHSVKVLNGSVEDERFFCYMAEPDEDDDDGDPATWAKGNPNLGVTVQAADLADEYAKAKSMPSALGNFRRLKLNRWVAGGDDAYFDMAAWNACPRILPDLKGRRCYGGLDLAATQDIAAFVLFFPPLKVETLPSPEGNQACVLSYFWVPADNIPDRGRRYRVPLESWCEHGYCTATDGNVIDYEVISKAVAEAGAQYVIDEIAYDNWRATEIVVGLAKTGLIMVPMSQQYSTYNAPMQRMLDLVSARLLNHGGHPVLRWMASNTVVGRDDADRVKPLKNKGKRRYKIDGIAAMGMAMNRWMVHEPKPSTDTLSISFI